MQGARAIAGTTYRCEWQMSPTGSGTVDCVRVAGTGKGLRSAAEERAREAAARNRAAKGAPGQERRAGSLRSGEVREQERLQRRLSYPGLVGT